ncbi:hypothetical protein [Salinithrix halophila]|uniref:Restriction endonuclease PvuII n=1 Tax=Salinithrix halophila TaxID=1485204 RepID=A0ABV8JGY3_9BACL
MTLKIKNEITNILSMVDPIEKEALKHDIIHVFDDGGYRELLLLKMFGLKKGLGRHGDDGIDPETNKRFELKTVNLINTSGKLRKNPGITTCHHVNHEVIKRYRQISAMVIGIFYLTKPARIYELPTIELESYFQRWETKLVDGKLDHLNNPKIKFKDVLEKGILHYHDPEFDQFLNGTHKSKQQDLFNPSLT